MYILVGWAINSIALYVTAFLIRGIQIDSISTLILAGLVIGLVNTLIKPIAQIVSLPLTIITFGIFALFVNAAMLGLAAWLVPGFHIDSFLSAFLGAIVLSVVSSILHSLLTPKPITPSV